MDGYRDRLRQACERRGRLCVGIDPHPELLAAWGLSNGAAGVESFCRTIIEAIGEQVAVFKPQSAFFEAYGPSGIAVLARTLRDISEVGALSILDVKRADIGSTMSAYARAYLDPDSELRADAVTLNPYLGFGSLSPAFELAHQGGAGVYILVRTSNPEGNLLQTAVNTQGRSVAQQVVDEAKEWQKKTGFDGIGLVIGATLSELGIDLSGFDGSILAPGIGVQGGRLDQISRLFGEAAEYVLPSVSREVLGAGPKLNALHDKLVHMVGAAR